MEFDVWRVSDAAFARAYAKTGDRGRALIKTCIAGLYQAWRPGNAVSTVTTERFHDGQVRVEELTPRPWFALAIAPEIASPAQLVAAVMPALVSRIPLVVAFRPKARTGWPSALLTTLELCGVEQVFAPSMKNFRSCLDLLAGQTGLYDKVGQNGPYGGGGLVCLGSRQFRDRIGSMAPEGCRVHWLAPPESAALFIGPGVDWDREALAFAHAGIRLRGFDVPDGLESDNLTDGHPWAAFTPAALAPTGVSLVLEPGREVLWDWPDMPRELFFTRSLVYS